MYFETHLQAEDSGTPRLNATLLVFVVVTDHSYDKVLALQKNERTRLSSNRRDDNSFWTVWTPLIIVITSVLLVLATIIAAIIYKVKRKNNEVYMLIFIYSL